MLYAFWDSLTFPIRRHCLQLLITLLNFVAVWDESLFSRRLFYAVCSGCNNLSLFFRLCCEQLWEKCCFLQINYLKVYLACSLKFWHCSRAGSVKIFKSEWLGWRWWVLVFFAHTKWLWPSSKPLNKIWNLNVVSWNLFDSIALSNFIWEWGWQGDDVGKCHRLGKEELGAGIHRTGV